jgi:hypothetical protein
MFSQLNTVSLLIHLFLIQGRTGSEMSTGKKKKLTWIYQRYKNNPIKRLFSYKMIVFYYENLNTSYYYLKTVYLILDSF